MKKTSKAQFLREVRAYRRTLRRRSSPAWRASDRDLTRRCRDVLASELPDVPFGELERHA